MSHQSPRRGSASRESRYIAESLEYRTLLSTVSLVKDINYGTQGGLAIPLGQMGGETFFAQYSTSYTSNYNLYRTDGIQTTGLGTAAAGPASKSAGLVFNSKVYFPTAGNGSAWLADTDATSQFITPLTQLSSDSSLIADMFVSVGSKFFFSMTSQSTSAKSLWVSDGTAGGTKAFSVLAPGAASQTFVQSQVIANRRSWSV